MKKILLYTVAALPVLFYFFNVFHFAQNVPVTDDYESILNFMNTYFRSESFNEKIQMLFSSYNQHRLLLLRLSCLALYELNGFLDLRILNYIGNLTMLILFLLILKSVDRKMDWKILLPVSYLLFVFIYWDLIFLPMICTSMYVIPFSLLTIFFYIRKRYTLFVFFFLIALFSNGSGIFSLFTVTLYVLFLERNWLKFSLLFALFLLLFAWYAGGASSAHTGTLFSIHAIIQITGCFFAFLGAVFQLPGYDGVAIVFGIILFAYFLWMVKVNYYQHNTVVFFFMVFVLLTATVVALNRYQLGIENAVSPRYKLYSLLLLIFSYVSFIELFVSKINKKISVAFVVLSVFFNVAMNFFSLQKVCALSYSKALNMFSYSLDQKAILYADTGRGLAILKESVEQGFYKIPDYYYKDLSKVQTCDMAVMLDDSSLYYTINSTVKRDSFLILSGLIGQRNNANKLMAAGMLINHEMNKYYTPLAFENTGALIDADFSQYDNIPVREYRVLIPTRYLQPSGNLFFCLKRKGKVFTDVKSVTL
ncbi:MAG: hypothetical protein IPM95_03900 [Sphingobacteriales bacterium]|nr:hypothetical protein [Sphingobacteriales bacterium]